MFYDCVSLDAFVLHSTSLSSLIWVCQELLQCSVEQKKKQGGRIRGREGLEVLTCLG